jgi:hypothetical protein
MLTVLAGIALFVFSYFVAVFGGHLLIPLFGRTIATAMLASIVLAAFVMIGVGCFRLLRLSRSN